MAEFSDPRSAPGTSRDPRLVALAEDSGYEVLGRIGAGGMGIVYRARDADGHDVAIKMLRHEISDDPRARERLAREVAAQQRVRNSNIVRILDAELDSPDAFVVTEFVPGPTLEEAVRDHGGLHPEAVRELGLVMGATLQDIHASGVVHRDLKPSNVLLRGATEDDLTTFDPDGDGLDPVIIDFGIAIAAEESRMTSTGLVMGTAAYLDPEVVRTNHTGEAGDWWGWAALLAFAATGREPFGTGRADLVFLRAERGELDVDGAPAELIGWLRRALQAKPQERPTPAELLAELAELDLSYYEDPGPTEVFAAGTDALGVGGAPSEAGTGVEGEDAGRGEYPTAALPGGDPFAASAPDSGPHTEAIPQTEAPTEALPRIDSSTEQRTEAIPQMGTPTAALPLTGAGPASAPHTGNSWSVGPPSEARTEALPRVEPATMPMPAIEPDLYRPVQRSAPGQPAPAPYPSAPLQPAPQQLAPPNHVAPQQAPSWQQGYPVPGTDPRASGPWAAPFPRPPRRPFLVSIGLLLLIGVGAIAPYVSLTLVLLLGALARTWERSHLAVADRRMRGSAGSGPVLGAGLAAPFRFLGGLLEIALQALLPLVLGLLVGIALDVVLTLLQGTAPPDGLAFGVAMAITVLITWVGIGSRTTRNGAHRMVDAAAPDTVWTAVLLGLLALMAAAVVLTILARQGMVDYFPFPHAPRLNDIAIWRR